MSTAATRLNRMISLVAELGRRRDGDEPSATLDELARLLGTTPEEIQADLRRMTYLDESSDTEWLLSLQLIVEGDRVEGGSGGPFRRPMRLTPDELLVLRLSLGVDGDEVVGLGETPDSALQQVAPYSPGEGEEQVVDVLLRAIDQRQCVELRYAGSGSDAPTVRTVHPYQVLANWGRTYVVGWCEMRGKWRRFRLDRILDLIATEDAYAERTDCPYDQIFVGSEDPLDPVQVRFSQRIARWISERHPSATENRDGTVTVTYQAATADWLTERVLQYGADAEVVGPGFYRDAVQKAVS